jgi:hypothetical protein
MWSIEAVAEMGRVVRGRMILTGRGVSREQWKWGWLLRDVRGGAASDDDKSVGWLDETGGRHIVLVE